MQGTNKRLSSRTESIFTTMVARPKAQDPAPVAPGMIPTWIAYAAGNGDVEPQIVLTSLWEQLHRWTKGSSNGSYEQAPFVCLAEMTTTTLDEFMPDSLAADFAGYAQSALTADTSEQLMTTQEAVRKGMCVIDGGATQTVGSLAALEAVVDQNRRKHGATKIKAIDSVNPPTCSFSNSTENRCMSTAKLEVSANGLPG